MRAVGIIAEYNPFHNGHLYHIQKVKEMYPDSCLVVAMVGNFTERGEATILDKWKRTKIALLNGADLVVEIPYPFATQSADFFSYGGITLLEKLGCSSFVFGSESNDLDTLSIIAKTQIENEEFDKLVKIYSKLGKNYPTAISSAIFDLTGMRIETPNDLLGVSYLKMIYQNHYKIIPKTIQRTNDYHDKELHSNIVSATAIREELSKKKEIKKYVPENSLSYYQNLHFMDDYFPMLKYKIITEKDLSIYQTVEEGIEQVLKREIIDATSYDDFIHRIKSKRYTYNKISRMLLHILCGFTKEKAKEYSTISYIRVLGFNDLGRQYLNQIKKDCTLPIISKVTKEKDSMLEFELETTRIYSIPYNDCNHKEEEKIIYLGGNYD